MLRFLQGATCQSIRLHIRPSRENQQVSFQKGGGRSPAARSWLRLGWTHVRTGCRIFLLLDPPESDCSWVQSHSLEWSGPLFWRFRLYEVWGFHYFPGIQVLHSPNRPPVEWSGWASRRFGPYPIKWFVSESRGLWKIEFSKEVA